MDDRSFRRFGGVCAFGVAICAVVYGLLLLLDAPEPAAGLLLRAQAALSNRGLNTLANTLLALGGLFTTAAVAALYARLADEERAWIQWGAVLGVIGGVLMAIHGYWEALRKPILLAQWQTGLEGRQAAISAFSGVPNPVDPRGIGSFLFVGLFVLVAATLVLRRGNFNALVGQVGMVYGILLVILFLSGFFNLGTLFTVLGGLTVGIVGPVWWILVGRELIKG